MVLDIFIKFLIWLLAVSFETEYLSESSGKSNQYTIKYLKG